jgi:hypothetical protein
MLWLQTKTRVVLDKNRIQKAEYRKQNVGSTIIFNSDFWILNSYFVLVSKKQLKRPIIILIRTTFYTFAQDNFLQLDATSFLLKAQYGLLLAFQLS